MPSQVRLPGRKTLRLAWRWARSRIRTRALVLGYHRVDAHPRDPYGLRVSPSRFEQHLEVLRRWARPVPLSRLARGVRAGEVPESAVAVTFDDGYAGLSSEALPRLTTYEVPATLFVVTDLLGREPWWETLARAVADGGVSGPPNRSGSPERGGDGGVEGEAFRSATGHSLRGVYRRLAALPPAERNLEIEDLVRQSGISRGDSAAADELRLLSAEEVRRIARDGPVEVGAHSATHPDLTALEDGGREEIDRSVARVRELIDRPVLSFSYPHGRTSSRVMESVRRAGLLCACASHSDVVGASSDPYLLPRFWPGDWDGDRFARWLRRWLGR